MNKARIFIFTIALMVFGSMGVFALTDTVSHDVTMQINEIALLDLNDDTAITLTTNAPTAGGETVLGDSDATKLLQYTSLVAGTATRTITASWGGTDAAPSGTSLLLAATVPSGAGTTAGQITLSSTGQSIITGIGSVATGTGANGAALTYTFQIDDVTALSVGDSETVTITFTLTEDL